MNQHRLHKQKQKKILKIRSGTKS